MKGSIYRIRHEFFLNFSSRSGQQRNKTVGARQNKIEHT